MAIMIRIAAVLGAIWSMIVLGVLAALGTLITFFDMNSRTHTNMYVLICVGLEITLLGALWQAGKLRLLAAPVIWLWFVAFSALINFPFNLRAWPDHLWGALSYMWPVTLTLLLLTLHGVVEYVKTRRDSHRKAAALPSIPPIPAMPVR
ncbi:MAG: hypothetical protein JWN14_1254 [Chthonomonadales bacterium]|nr:hypothetical protein [Chthonomonadales bacterium]